MRFPVVLAAILLLLSHTSSQAVDFTVLGGWNFAAPTERVNYAVLNSSGGTGTDLHWTGDSGLSYGATITFPIADLPFEFETGFFKLKENSTRDADATSAETGRSIEMSMIPAVIRFVFDEHVAMGGGIYFGTGVQNPSAKGNDFGFMVNARARLNISYPFSFIIDGRYQHGTMNRAFSSSDLFNTRSIQGFIGLQYHWEIASEPEPQAPRYRY